MNIIVLSHPRTKRRKKNNVNKLLAAQSSSSLPSSFFEIPDPSIPPNKLYSNNEESLYATFDERGIPLTLKKNGEKISQKLRTKLLREYNAQQKRHDKYLKEAELLSAIASARSFEYNQNLRPYDEKESTISTSSSSSSQQKQKQKLSSSFLHLIRGTSSSNDDQALEFQSDMGPLSHILEI
eukprot:CAMPEP_0178966074 /NCGR_PEP_ID=MMETSP0789-20121207/16706_1 /TAXON_ID=3005 /ORGANISM="Rhizosolenia setigera, Strain CCMP 1694" /LENGTH=181 /DNA_ID=CAMNT_0020651271 /DNA_START=145 /DNA_END=690 /DNA_ORIENTATION=+